MLEEFEDDREGAGDEADAGATRAGRRAARHTGSGEPRPRRIWRRILAVLLGLLFLVVVGVGGFAAFLASTVSSNVTQADLLGTGAPSPGATPLPSASPLPTTPGVNVLLLGSDARPGDTVSRSDVIVLVHIPQDRSKIYLVHFPRDMYVAIPGHGKNKINAAFAYGGAPLLVRTLEDLVKVRIDHVAKTDFNGFVRMTDAVGGVRVYAEEASDGSGNGGKVVIHQGWNDLDGEQAIAFVRERYQLSQGDLSRGRRQMAWIKAIIVKATSLDTLTSPQRIAAFTDAATQNMVVDTGFTLSVMRDLGFSLRNVRAKDVVFITAPISGFANDPSAGAIDVVSAKGIAALGEHLRTDTMADYADASVLP